MRFRNSVLAGLTLSALVIFLTFGTILVSFWGLLISLVPVLAIYGYAAIRKTQPETTEDALILHRGMKWGLALGGGWVLTALTNLIPQPGVLAAVFLPFLVGALGAIRTGRVSTGTREGFWAGMVGGLMGFLALAAAGYLRAWSSDVGVLAFMDADEYGALQLAMYTLIFYGPIFCPLAALIGGWVGIQLEKTGRVRDREGIRDANS